MAALAGLLLAACGSPLGPDDIKPDPSAPVQTSALRYTVQEDAFEFRGVIPLTFANQGPRVYFDLCGISLEHFRESGWMPVFAPVCIGGSPISIGTGETYRADFVFFHPFDPNTFPRFPSTPVSGKYRVVMQFYATLVVIANTERVADPLPPAAGTSNAFWLDFP